MGEISKERKLRIIIPIVHFLIATVHSASFFEKLVMDTGSENLTYDAGRFVSLAEDTFSVWMCKGMAYVLAAVMVYFFWQYIFEHAGNVANNKRASILIGVGVLIGVICVVTLYPANWAVETKDDYMNYVYAKEFLPMYWHGFVTNAVYCACLILIPHPAVISVIQLLLGCSAFVYLVKVIQRRIMKVKKTYIMMIVMVLTSIVCVPELLRILLYPTRNCMYAILSMWLLIILFTDYMQDKTLTKKRYILLVFLTAFLATWRGEGILYVIAFPVLIFFAYRLGKNQVWTKEGALGMMFFIAVCVLLSAPDKYGVNKYQNSDYLIANTTGPLSAVFHDTNANLTYKNAKDDLDTINKVVPLEYIERYGCNGGFYFNAISGRWPRQHGVSKEVGNEYVTSAYRMLLQNLPMYLKYQTNLFIWSNCLKIRVFDIEYGVEELDEVTKLEPYARAFELYDAGEADLKVYNLWGSRYSKSLEKRITGLYTYLRNRTSGIKILMLMLLAVIVVVSLWKKEYFITAICSLCLGILFVIILMAPAVRPNYYYSVFLNIYLCLICYGVMKIGLNMKRKRGKKLHI